MSASSFHTTESVLATRSMYAKSGTRKKVKVSCARLERRAAEGQVRKEVQALDFAALSAMSPAELEAQADQWLDAYWFDAHDRDDVMLDDEPEVVLAIDEEPELPLALQASLPDWMLSEMERAKGNAFELLSLLEAKPVSPKARFFDDALYA